MGWVDLVSSIVCVTGMHRSGTSLLANWVNELGVRLDFGNLIPAEFWNKRGHYEDEILEKFQSGILLKHHAASHGWKVFDDRFIDFTSNERNTAKSILEERSQVPCWGWKDPRSIFFLPEWFRIKSDMVVIIVWRPAIEVVSSLVARSNRAQMETPGYSDLLRIGFQQSINLWKTYNRLAIKLKRNYPDSVYLMPLQELVENDAKVFHLIQGTLDCKLKYSSVSKVFDPGLMGKAKQRYGSLRREYLKFNVAKVENNLISLSG